MDYRVSVIIPIFKIDDDVDATVRSIIDQSIGFEESIQMILVCCAGDEAKSICEGYSLEYPNNITTISKEGLTDPAVRNIGLDYAEGQFSVFLRVGDSWDRDAIKKAVDFFDANLDKMDICICKPIKSDSPQGKNDQASELFTKGNRVLSLIEEPKTIIADTGNLIFKTETIKEMRFEDSLSYGYEPLFANDVLLIKNSIGVVSDGVYYYKRKIKSSVFQTQGLPQDKSLYMDVPSKYYLGVINKSMERCGRVEEYIQNLIMADIKLMGYKSRIVPTLSDEDKEVYLSNMQKVLSHIEDKKVSEIKNVHYNFGLYLFKIKYGKEISKLVKLKDGKYYVNGIEVADLTTRKVLDVVIPEVNENIFRARGRIRLQRIEGWGYRFFVKDNEGNEYDFIPEAYDQYDIFGYVGETITEGLQFDVSVPIKESSELAFYLKVNDSLIQLHPDFNGESDLHGRWWNSYDLLGNYIVKRKGNNIVFGRNSWLSRTSSELTYKGEMTVREKKNAPKWLARRSTLLSERRLAHSLQPKNRIAFISVRSDDLLSDNMRLVYEKVKGPKEFITAKNLYNKPKERRTAFNLLYSSKVVVTDDYLGFLKKHGKKKNQKIVQLWHACGAFKKFGKDGTELFPPVDAMFHRDYDLVTVSSEAVREIYTNAFGVDIDKVKATGVARTDMFFDPEVRRRAEENIYSKYPEFKEKEIIIYAPTFRDVAGTPRRRFRPALNFDKLSQSLMENQIFVICPHPVMTDSIVNGEYDNIIEMRDFSTDEMMYVSDLLVTDYSSVIFEYALLGKPMVFYCYDYYTYGRDFYLDYEKDLPGEIFKKEDEFINYIRDGGFKTDYRLKEFVEKYMSACDGHSAERIAGIVDDFLRESSED